MGNKASRTKDNTDATKPSKKAPVQTTKLVSVYAGFDPNLVKQCDCAAAKDYRKSADKAEAKMKKKKAQQQQLKQQTKN